ncbi:MAG: hypothetical protein CYG59_03290 [Chloroflexi bacterium]|nr:MAG: hypothetical protein CYG59_03290 [Chloroflexota bacterium]
MVYGEPYVSVNRSNPRQASFTTAAVVYGVLRTSTAAHASWIVLLLLSLTDAAGHTHAVPHMEPMMRVARRPPVLPAGRT